MKKIIVIFTIVTFIDAILVQPVEAHFLKTDHNIGAILHVDPNDDPVAKEQASFFFEFKDLKNQFKPKLCDCEFSILENGAVIYSQPLFQNNQNPSLTNTSVFYTFPQKDVYQVQVIGKPVSENAFQPFILTWDFRVDQEANHPSQPATYNFFTDHLIHFVEAGILIAVFIGLIVSQNKKKHRDERR